MPASPIPFTFSVTAGQTTTIVAAGTAGEKIHVYGFSISGSAANTIAEFEDGDTTTLSQSLRLAANGTIVAPLSTVPYFSTIEGAVLNLQATTGNVTGFVLAARG